MADMNDSKPTKEPTYKMDTVVLFKLSFDSMPIRKCFKMLSQILLRFIVLLLPNEIHYVKRSEVEFL